MRYLIAPGTMQPVRSAYQPPASSTFLSERISHQQPAATSHQYSSLRTNQHQPSATSQPNRLMIIGYTQGSTQHLADMKIFIIHQTMMTQRSTSQWLSGCHLQRSKWLFLRSRMWIRARVIPY
jgi:hypothetical protein